MFSKTVREFKESSALFSTSSSSILYLKQDKKKDSSCHFLDVVLFDVFFPFRKIKVTVSVSTKSQLVFQTRVRCQINKKKRLSMKLSIGSKKKIVYFNG
jgi:hypothetical protein